MPKSLSHKILDNQEKSHPLMPLVLGGATFFLPCGFTQSLQLFALTTGSFTTSALTLFVFALGTAPMLLALGFAGNSLKGKAGKFFYQFSGALVVVLGLWNMQNGLAIAGYPVKLPSLSKPISVQTAPTAPAPAKNDGSEQVVKMTVGYSGYEPDNFTVKVGVPVRWEVDGTDAGGCGQVLVSRQIGVQQVLNTGINVINFTPKEAGEIAFSCSMGMYRGSFTVVN